MVRKNALQDALRPVAELGGNVTIRYSPLVKDALDHGFPVVALETGIITHALPHPMNLETALAVEEQLKAAKVVPATIGVIDGDAVIGLTPEELTRLAKDRPEIVGLTADLILTQCGCRSAICRSSRPRAARAG